MSPSNVNVGVLADFNGQNLANLLVKHGGEMYVKAILAPFGQVMQHLLQTSGEFWDNQCDVIVVWTFPNIVVPQFNRVLEFLEWSEEDLYKEVDVFAGLIQRIDKRTQNIFLPTWVPPPLCGHRPSIEMKNGIGTANTLMRMNLRLAERFETDSRIVLFNTERWIQRAGPGAHNDKLWYLSKTPFSKTVFEEAASDMVAALRGSKGLRKKVVLLDLDNTLWGGVVGDVGWESVQVGGHDAVGEAYLEFQKELKRLSSQGVILALVSKNEESVAMETIEKKPEMLLRTRDFAGWRINWEDKAQNIVDLMAELNLGLESAVFIDDSPQERNRVRGALPEVLVPEWPSDPLDYARALRQLRCFDAPLLSNEDRARTRMYVSDRERRALQVEFGSLEAWLETLDLEIGVEDVDPSNLERAGQLFNKTNQMNLSTRRMMPQDLAAWSARKENLLRIFRVKDKLGDYGVCGIASLTFCESRAKIVDFLLSCRAMGRGVEEAMLSVMAKQARDHQCQTLEVLYVPTTKNTPCLRWIEGLTCFAKQGEVFLLQLDLDVPSPKHIRIAFHSNAHVPL